MESKKYPSVWIAAPTLIIAAASFWASCEALAALAKLVNFSPFWVLPLVLDGVMVACAIIGSRAITKGLSDFFPRLTLFVFTFLSFIAQVSYSFRVAGATPFDWAVWHCWVDIILHGIPPFSNVIMVEFLLGHQRGVILENTLAEKRNTRLRDAIASGKLPSPEKFCTKEKELGSVKKAAEFFHININAAYKLRKQIVSKIIPMTGEEKQA